MRLHSWALEATQLYADMTKERKMQKYRGYEPKVYTKNQREIDAYIRAIPFETRREPQESKAALYHSFKQFLDRLDGITSKEYERGIQRFCDKVLF